MSSIKIRKIGNSLGFLLPKEIQASLHLAEGDLLSLINLGNGRIILEAHIPHHSLWKFDNSVPKTSNKDSINDSDAWENAELIDKDDYVSKW